MAASAKFYPLLVIIAHRNRISAFQPTFVFFRLLPPLISNYRHFCMLGEKTPPDLHEVGGDLPQVLVLQLSFL